VENILCSAFAASTFLEQAEFKKSGKKVPSLRVSEFFEKECNTGLCDLSYRFMSLGKRD